MIGNMSLVGGHPFLLFHLNSHHFHLILLQLPDDNFPQQCISDPLSDHLSHPLDHSLPLVALVFYGLDRIVQFLLSGV